MVNKDEIVLSIIFKCEVNIIFIKIMKGTTDTFHAYIINMVKRDY